MPISWVRLAVECATTPKIPIAARNNAEPAKNARISVSNRGWLTVFAMRCSMVWTSLTGDSVRPNGLRRGLADVAIGPFFQSPGNVRTVKWR